MLHTRILETCTECEYGIHGRKPLEMDGQSSCCIGINLDSGSFDIHSAVWGELGVFNAYPDPCDEISWCHTYRRRTNAACKVS
jgi:hypothetical protein